MIGCSGSEKTKVLFSLIKNQQSDINKVYLYIKDPFKSMYQLLINGRVKVGIENWENPKTCIDYTQKIYDVYENLEDYNARKKKMERIVFDDMIADRECN